MSPQSIGSFEVDLNFFASSVTLSKQSILRPHGLQEFSVALYKKPESREMQMPRHTAEQVDTSFYPMLDWRDDDQFSW